MNEGQDEDSIRSIPEKIASAKALWSPEIERRPCPEHRKPDGDLYKMKQICRHRIMQGLEGHGEDSEPYPKGKESV